MSDICQKKYFIGVDVGTGSVRAGVVSGQGSVIATSVQPITIFNPLPNHFEQSSDEIWLAVCTTVRSALEKSLVSPEQVHGICFDATCSLVILDKDFAPLAVNSEGQNHRNIILWMDHRAINDSQTINSLKHRVLRYVGNSISPEMQTPKIRWLKKNLHDTFSKACHFFDLADYLSFKSTGSLTRSTCTLTCKFTFLAHEKAGQVDQKSSEITQGWSSSYFKDIELSELTENNFSRIGCPENVLQLGTKVNNLSSVAAEQLGLTSNCQVGVSIIDAHAGAVGILGSDLTEISPDLSLDKYPIFSRLAIIAGTSSCHMAVSSNPVFVPGVWGPYYDSLVPKYWLLEGGQSATGALLDYVVGKMHPYSRTLKNLAEENQINIFEYCNKELKKQKDYYLLSREMHVLPYFHGNRSPRADPTLLGIISGLSLREDFDDLLKLYLSIIQSIAYGDRHIVESMRKEGMNIKIIFCVGGLSFNSVYLQELANITQCIVITSRENDTVLLGSAVLAACASKYYHSLEEAMSKMNHGKDIYHPNPETFHYHENKYQIFMQMYQDQMKYRSIMEI